MLRKSSLILLLCFSLSFSEGFSADNSPALKRLATLLNFKTLTARFVQTVHTEGRLTQESRGSVWIKRPGQFRWQVSQPNFQLLVVNGRTVWQYDPDLAQATRQVLSASQNINAVNLLSGDTKQLLHYFRLQNAYLSPGKSEFILIPTVEHLFKKMTLFFEKDRLIALETENALGQRVLFRFYSLQLNRSLLSTLFEFKAPKGVDVLDGS